MKKRFSLLLSILRDFLGIIALLILIQLFISGSAYLLSRSKPNHSTWETILECQKIYANAAADWSYRDCVLDLIDANIGHIRLL